MLATTVSPRLLGQSVSFTAWRVCKLPNLGGRTSSETMCLTATQAERHRLSQSKKLGLENY